LKICQIKYILINSDILFDAILAISVTALPAIVELNSSPTSLSNDGVDDVLFSES
jgi:hypothetical protein